MNKLQQKILSGCGIAILALSSGITAFSQQQDTRPQTTQPTQVKTIQSEEDTKTSKPTDEPKASQPAVETKTETKTRELPFETKYVDDNTLTKGSTKTTQNGINGVETTTYTVTYTDGKETARKVTRVDVTKQPVAQIIARGTYVAPKPTTTSTSKPAAQNCANGTYVNSAGNTVCRPVQSSTRPSGATARCRDGSYSYSQSRRGTCSHHGGVAQWY